MARPDPKEDNLESARYRLFVMVENAAGYAFPNDDEQDHAGSWEELAQFAESCGRGLAAGSAVCRNFARGCRRRARQDPPRARAVVEEREGAE